MKLNIQVYNNSLNNDLLDKFRYSVLFDDCVGFDHRAHTDTSYTYTMMSKDHSTFEDGYRFSAAKFFKTKFHHILAVLDNDRIVAFSGAIEHGRYLKFGVFHYILKSYRSDPNVRMCFWRDNGLVDKHKSIANNLGKAGLFFTVFAHSKKMEAMVKNMKGKKRHNESYSSINLSLIKYYDEVNYQNVQQSLFYIPLDNSFNIEELKNSL
jgi:hypothetical protein